MKVSLCGLKRFIDLTDTPESIGETFVKLGLEVASVVYKGLEKSDAIVVGKILDFEQHPNAERLRICQVDVGDGHHRQIVCGATNFKKGDCVPVALPGAVLPGNLKIKQSRLRGVLSEGMMCSGRELGLDADHTGLLILGQNESLGTKIHSIFPDNDVIFEIELTANRGDALSHYGVARELGAWYDIPLKPITVPSWTSVLPPGSDRLEVEIHSDHCEFYSTVILKNIKVQESVDWIRRDLEAVGIAVVNNVVDVTNWVMITYGQPLHAFDRSKVGEKIIVRPAHPEEKITALDGKTYATTTSMLLISDENQPLAIAGIIGNASTKINQETTTIVLESACFSADRIRRTARALGINTDSAYRYIHHVDGAQTENFLKIAAQMLMDLYGAVLATPIIKTSQNADFSPRKIELDPNFVRRTFGFSIEDDVIFSILKRLGYDVHRQYGQNWIVYAPAFRWDVTRPIDLVEECLRIYGVDKIPCSRWKMDTLAQTSLGSTKKRKEITQCLMNHGFIECYNYSLGTATEDALPLANPLLENQTHMRTSLIPGLLEAFRYNFQNGNQYAQFFESGHVVLKMDNSYEELTSVAFLMPTESSDVHWDAFAEPTFFDAKSKMRQIWAIATDEAFEDIEAFKNILFEAGYSAKIGDLRTKAVEAHMGYLSNAIAKEFKMPLIIGEIFIKIPHMETENRQKKYHSFSHYPAARRDISIIVDRDYPAQDVVREILKMTEAIGKAIFTDIEVAIFDVYHGEHLPAKKKSLGLNLSFKNDQKTPSDKEIDHVFGQLIATIRQDARFELRG
ncbi:MAG: phenylalanine--tRNA ligase subunit beta [Puniceicoccales bacterium]|jgi:phenylalanyl-tRNA synthetase beta chain|nr:phenylalanine--tRNA ligase subunit beta [Puniceicoccales bacterium]